MGEFAKENLNVAAQYTDLATGGDVSSPDEIAMGEGAVMRHGLSKIAVYRDENGCYDGIASIEMFEAVGEAYWPSYFAALRRCLAPGGRACVQTIVIADPLFARYRVGTDFIRSKSRHTSAMSSAFTGR